MYTLCRNMLRQSTTNCGSDSDFLHFFTNKLKNMNNQIDKTETEQNRNSDSTVPIHSDVSEFVIRLKSLIGDDTIASFARKCGVPESTIRSYLARGKTPGMEHLAAIAASCGVTVDWLATGKGIKYKRDLKHAEERLNSAPPAVAPELPIGLEPYRKRLDALINYLAMIDDEEERDLILSDFILRAEKIIELSELKHAVNQMRATYNKQQDKK